MIPINVQINTAAVETELAKLEKLIQTGTENGVKAASKEAGILAHARIPVLSGKTQGKLRVTFSRRKGDFVGRIGVRRLVLTSCDSSRTAQKRMVDTVGRYRRGISWLVSRPRLNRRCQV